jgi:hypothetical protein
VGRFHCNLWLPAPRLRRKAPSSMGRIGAAEVLRLRAASAVSHDQSVRRSAQDDESAGV